MTKPESLDKRMRQFFAENPAEELTYADAMVKFGCTRREVVKAVYRLRQYGRVESVHTIRAPRSEVEA